MAGGLYGDVLGVLLALIICVTRPEHGKLYFVIHIFMCLMIGSVGPMFGQRIYN